MIRQLDADFKSTGEYRQITSFENCTNTLFCSDRNLLRERLIHKSVRSDLQDLNKNGYRARIPSQTKADCHEQKRKTSINDGSKEDLQIKVKRSQNSVQKKVFKLSCRAVDGFQDNCILSRYGKD